MREGGGGESGERVMVGFDKRVYGEGERERLRKKETQVTGIIVVISKHYLISLISQN